MAERLVIDETKMTLGDLKTFKEIAGVKLQQAFAAGPDGKIDPEPEALIALTYIVKRRENPNFTLEQAEAIQIDELVIGEADPPTDAASTDGSPPSAPSTE